MKSNRSCSAASAFLRPLGTALCLLLALATTTGRAQTPASLVDDFSRADQTSRGAPRLMFDDKALGGHSHGTQQCAAGILSVAGELAPNRGSPAFITVPLLLSTDGTAQDLSAYQGVRVKLKVTKGNIYVQVGSSAITNFDYHTSEVIGRSPGGFREIRIPFTAMKRAWSEQVPLDRKTVTSVNLVAVGMAKDQFAYEVDEVGLY